MKIKTLLATYLFIFPFFYFMVLKDILLVIVAVSMFSIFIKRKTYKVSKQIFNMNFFLLSFVCFTSIISLVYIGLTFEDNMSAVLGRFGTQLFRFVFILFEVYMGMKLLQYLNEKVVIKILLYSVVLTVILALYQNIAYIYNLPLWGLYFSHNDKFAIDTVVGFRNNALCGEPKYLSVYMAVAFFFVKDLSGIYMKKIFSYILMIAILFVFLKTSSANGILGFLILVMINIYFYNKKIFYITIVLIPALVSLFLNYYEYIIFRPSHLLIIDAITSGKINMSYMDDLVYLPWLSWTHFAFMLPLGFGLGLLHYYAINFIDMTQWFNLDSGYIDSNVAFISVVSNFGLLLVLSVSTYFVISVERNIKYFQNENTINLIKFTTYSFFVGLFIGGNLTIMFFISIGIIMYYNKLRKHVNEN